LFAFTAQGRSGGRRAVRARGRGIEVGLAVLGLAILSLPSRATTFDYPPVVGDRKVVLNWQPDSGGDSPDPFFTANTVVRLEEVFDQIHGAGHAVRLIRLDGANATAYSFATGETTIRHWRFADGVVLGDLSLGNLPEPVDLSCHHSDALLMASFSTGRVAIWNLQAGTAPQVTSAGDAPLLSAQFFPAVTDSSDQAFISVGTDDSVRVWIGPGQLRYALAVRRSAESTDKASGALAIGGEKFPLFAAGTDSGWVRVWQMSTVKPESPFWVLGPHPGPVRHIAFSPDQNRLATSDESGRVCLWNLTNGTLIGQVETGQPGPWVEFAQPFGRLIFEGLADGTLELHSGDDGRLLRRENLLNRELTFMTSNRDGGLVVSGDASGRVSLIRAGLCRPSAAEPRCFGGYKIWRSPTPDERDPHLKLLRVYTYNDPNFGDSTWTFVGDVRQFADPESIIVRTAPPVSVDDPVTEEVPLSGPHNGIPYFYSVTRFDLVYLGGGVFEVLNNSIQDGFYREPGSTDPVPVVAEAPARTHLPELGDITVVPNPYEMGKVPWDLAGQPHLEFRNLPEFAKIRIFTASGDFVRQINHQHGRYGETRNAAEWNLRNEAGRMVTSGVYIYRISTPAAGGRPGEEIQGYFLVIM
jgi:hypothetical protein